MRNDTRLAIMIIKKHLNSKCKKRMRTNSQEFMQYSYSKTALKEILFLLKKNPNISPISIIEDFENRMKILATTKAPTVGWIFSIWEDVAKMVLDDLICIKERNENEKNKN